MKFWVGFVLPKKAFNEIVKVQREISRKCDTYRSVQSRIGPHFTITFQPSIKKKYVSEIEGVVKNVSKEIKPFKVETLGIARFYKTKTVYMKVLKSDKLSELHRVLCYKLNKYGKIRRYRVFTPHVTIAYNDITDENLSKAFAVLKKREFHYGFVFDRICLAKGEDRVKVYKSLKL